MITLAMERFQCCLKHLVWFTAPASTIYSIERRIFEVIKLVFIESIKRKSPVSFGFLQKHKASNNERLCKRCMVAKLCCRVFVTICCAHQIWSAQNTMHGKFNMESGAHIRQELNAAWKVNYLCLLMYAARNSGEI